MKVISLFAAGICGFLSLGCLIVLLWAAVFPAGWVAAVALIWCLACAPRLRIKWRWRTAMIGVGLLLLIVTLPASIAQVNGGIHRLAQKPRTLSHFSRLDKFRIYGLHAAMGLAGAPLYPEVSRATLLLLFPHDSTPVCFRSDFTRGSRRVQAARQAFMRQLSNRSDSQTTQTVPLRWSAAEYQIGNPEARYALALNPSVATFHATRTPQGWTIETRLDVEVRYPASSLVTLIRTPELKVEEGLFWILQEAHWLHPYTARWQDVFSAP